MVTQRHGGLTATDVCTKVVNLKKCVYYLKYQDSELTSIIVLLCTDDTSTRNLTQVPGAHVKADDNLSTVWAHETEFISSRLVTRAFAH